MRKAPTQMRAKERVARILDATDALIVESGVAGFSVNDIAARANVAIGSLYQYFTNRDEILRALCARYYDTLRGTAIDSFSDVRTIADFIRDLREALVACWDFTQENEGYRRLFFDVQAWEIVREVDWDDTLLNARRMEEALGRLMPHIPRARVLALCVIVGDTASGTARLAARFEDLQSELFSEFLDMVESRIYALLHENSVIGRGAAAVSIAPHAWGRTKRGPSLAE